MASDMASFTVSQINHGITRRYSITAMQFLGKEKSGGSIPPTGSIKTHGYEL